MNPPPPSPRIPSTSKRVIFWATLAGLVVLGLVGYGIFNMGNTAAASGIAGKVISKKFVPRPEEQITIGAGGLKKVEKSGLHYLGVKANDTKEIYSVLVDENTYNRIEIGERYQIPKAALEKP